MTIFLSVIAIIFALLIIMIILGTIVDIGDYYDNVNEFQRTHCGCINLKFSTFLNFYSTNPTRWTINGSSYPVYTMPCGEQKVKYFYICFNYIDAQRYYFWKINRQEDQKETERMKEMAEFTKAIREDINEAKEESQKTINEQIEVFVAAKKRIELEMKGSKITVPLDETKCVIQNPDDIKYEIVFDQETNTCYLQDARTGKRLK